MALLKAWNAACSSPVGTPKVIVPRNYAFLVNPVLFHGPCKARNIDFVVSGIILAPNSPKVWNGCDASQWLAFRGITGLNVYGAGTIDGRGKDWWDQSCRHHPDLKGCIKLAPTALKFLSCNKSRVRDVHFINSPQTHVLIMRCNGLHVSNVTIQSPGYSPNTDGIHIQSSHHLTIDDAKIGSGDDCVSIGDYTSDLQITNVECGPGHGISIGSLGKGGNFVRVENIQVSNAFFKGTTNGARIKTWQVGKGYVRKVSFQNLKFDSVKNPLIIDQNYCNVRGQCKELETGVQVSDVVYKGLLGTSSTAVAINVNCSPAMPCTGISMESITLTAADAGKRVVASCGNARGIETAVLPRPCLRS
ncbi:probable polygalacturonase At1g80170 isoform X2 [Diospyros lotus]|uniref:probable polygalacturonase At1g80170 isoform X2 n=1 Tax=Diospyros lotus TaxID=55363 RepID=UPI0022583E4F|nr:probable polygalacturonase At1g80170 isoform X2 [Diospyros lotus]